MNIPVAKLIIAFAVWVTLLAIVSALSKKECPKGMVYISRENVCVAGSLPLN